MSSARVDAAYGSRLALRKLSPDYDVHDRRGAMNYLMERQEAGEVVTGLLYVEQDPEDLHANFNTTATPLNALGETELCPGSAMLDKINAGLR